jgi:uncharacterized membrane protein YkvA (DUF1232 family)
MKKVKFLNSALKITRGAVKNKGKIILEPIDHDRRNKGVFDVTKRMFQAYFNGSYRRIPFKTILWSFVTLLYVISPLDFIPDIIPVLGWLDDITMIGLLMKSFKRDLEVFLHWELGRA